MTHPEDTTASSDDPRLRFVGSTSHPVDDSATEYTPVSPQARLTYGGFISWLQGLGVRPNSIKTFHFGRPIGRGTYFSVSKHMVRAANFQAMDLAVATPGTQPYRTNLVKPNTYVAFKRLVIRQSSSQVDVSAQGQLYAMCREIQALVHPLLREHESIVKLHSIIWENGLGAGNESDSLMWPTLVLEFCDATLAEYQQSHQPLSPPMKSLLGSKIGNGLDALHTAGMIHGDLKSENVLVKVRDNEPIIPKLADFGCSVTLQEGDRRYYIGGTRMWCAPECPGWFTDVDDMIATDFYSFGLLLLRIGCDGRNPFEELGVISPEWTADEKLAAIDTLKEDDCLYPLLADSATRAPESEQALAMQLARMLHKDPKQRTEALSEPVEEPEKTLSTFNTWLQNYNEKDVQQDLLNQLTEGLDAINLQRRDEHLNENSEEESEEVDEFDHLKHISSLSKISLIPDLEKVSQNDMTGSLNNATKSRIVEELKSVSCEYTSRCSECCSMGVLDLSPNSVGVESVICEMRTTVESFASGRHQCKGLLADLPYEQQVQHSATYGSVLSKMSFRNGTASYQLFLATATGFGIEKDQKQALRILEDAASTGNIGLSEFIVRYARLVDLAIPTNLPLFKWLTYLCLFVAGIPSAPFDALVGLNARFAGEVALARNRIYNGYCAAFDFEQFHMLETPEQLTEIACTNTITAFLDDSGNSVLHLLAGSEISNLELLRYCIDCLGIEINSRNNEGTTPLLLASRAGRQANILELLRLGADATICHPFGETPLHWLGVLQTPEIVLKQYLLQGVDLNAQVSRARLTRNFSGGSRTFHYPSSPLVWAMAMQNSLAVDALLKYGASINFLNSSGVSPLDFACRPVAWRFLRRISNESTFKPDHSHVWLLLNWTEISMIANDGKLDDQVESLLLLLDSTCQFSRLRDVEEFYKFLIDKGIRSSKPPVLEVLLLGLSKCMRTINPPDVEALKYSDRPLSHQYWIDRRITHEAAKEGNPQILEAVLRYGGDATRLDGFDQTPLQLLSTCSDEARCVDVLVNHGALAVLDNKFQIHGMNALSNAIASCNFRVADRILKYTPIEQQERLFSSSYAQGMCLPPLSLLGHFAAWSSVIGERPLEYILDKCAERGTLERAFIISEQTRSTVFMAASGVKSGADQFDKEVFAVTRRRRTIHMLLERFPGSEHVDAKDNTFGQTALHLAVCSGNEDLVTALLDAGASVNLLNNAGLSPLDMTFDSPPEVLSGVLRDGQDGMIIKTFEQNRNNICSQLRRRGGIHASPIAIRNGFPNVLPFPFLYELGARLAAQSTESIGREG